MPVFEILVKKWKPRYELYLKQTYAPTSYEQGMGINPNGPVVQTDDYQELVSYLNYRQEMIEAEPNLEEYIKRAYRELDPDDYKLLELVEEEVKTEKEFHSLVYKEIPLTIKSR